MGKGKEKSIDPEQQQQKQFFPVLFIKLHSCSPLIDKLMLITREWEWPAANSMRLKPVKIHDEFCSVFHSWHLTIHSYLKSSPIALYGKSSTTIIQQRRRYVSACTLSSSSLSFYHKETGTDDKIPVQPWKLPINWVVLCSIA